MGTHDKMGFFLQLRILLWKNLVHKYRSPLVLLVELTKPLVLFVVLLCIRHKQPADPKQASHYRVQPLPSAGLTSIMQAFCDGGYQDEHGFTHYPQSTLPEFLSNLQHVAEHNNFFAPSFSLDDMDHIPTLYRRIIDDPAALHDAFKSAKDVKVADIFTNNSKLKEDLVQNFSLSAVDVDVLLSSGVNFTEVYRLLFGSSNTEDTLAHFRSKRRSPQFPHSIDPLLKVNSSKNAAFSLVNSMSNILDPQTALKTAIGMQNSFPNSPNANQAFQRIILGLNGAKSGFIPNSVLNNDAQMNQEPFYKGLIYKTIMKNPKLMTDPEVLDVMAKLLGFKDASGTDPVEVIDVLKKIFLTPDNLKYMTCTPDEIQRILIPQSANDTADLEQMSAVLCNMSHAQWQKLSTLILNHTSSADIVKKLHLENMDFDTTQQRVQNFYANIHEFTEFEKNMIALSTLAANLPNKTESCFPDAEAPPSFNVTHNETTTAMPDDKDKKTPPHQHSLPNYAGLLKVWVAMQGTVCGKTTITQEKLDAFAKSGNKDDLGLSRKMKSDLGLLIHVLYSNPKVLYAPNGSQADGIIDKANATFAMVDTISEYARKWLNVSTQIRAYLEKNTTEQNLRSIKEMQVELRSYPTMVDKINDPVVKEFIKRGSVQDTAYYLAQLDAVDKAACSWLTLVKGISLNVFRGFATEEELVDYFLHEAYGDGVTVLASIIFDNLSPDGPLPPHVVYRIRQNATFTQTTSRVRDKYWYPGPQGSDYRYYHYGFVWIQDIIERAIVDIHAGRFVIEPGSYIHQMPYPCYRQDRFLFMIEHVMPLCLTISWVYSVAMLVQSIVYEKEQRLKEVMKMMGLNNSVHWLAWFITAFSQMTVTMIILTMMLKYGQVLMYSNPWIIFIVLEVFAVATISFSFLISVCYSKAKVAAACAGIVYFLTYVPYMYVAIREEAAGDHISAWAKSIASLLSTTAFGLGAKYFAFYEIEGVGVQWDNLNVSPVEDDQYNLMMVILMMVVDTLLYGLLTWYIENVHPGSYGLPKPWYFPLTTSYWCGNNVRTEPHQCSWRRLFCWWGTGGGGRGGRGPCRYSSLMDDEEEQQACAMAEGQQDRGNFEPDPSHIPLGVSISNLKKVYKNGKQAVNNLSLNLYEGQITSFLGHNGAGKTTTMSILTGMFPPTGGYASVYGLDIRSDMEEIRKSLGMCPQHNVLFDKFTVEEHLWFYARLKGMNTNDIKAEMDAMIEDIGLPKKRKNLVDCLSGGMKRKLSVAIAFVAGSRTVILDEPTAGVDPYARRDIWDLLIKYKKDRTILLSTHHMDEADLLGDRIAIISHGQVKCCGSSMFLKSTFGEGYHLILVKKPSDADVRSNDTLDDIYPDQSFQTRCSEERLTEFIQKHVATAYLKSESSQELHYILPFEAAKKGCFEKLFKEMDRSLDGLEISSYGVVDTSLEEVFLKVTERSMQTPEEENETNSAKELEGLDIGSHDPDDVPLIDAVTQPPGTAPHQPGHRREPSRDSSLLSGLSENECLINIEPKPIEGQRSNPGHARSASGGSLSDICEGSPAKLRSEEHACLLAPIAGPNLNRPGHQRSPSDESLRNLTTQQQHQHKAAHKRTPSDISLRTLAAIRGTYHKRTASDVSLRSAAAAAAAARGGHQRSPSDGSAGGMLGSPQRVVGGGSSGHQRTGSTGTDNSELLDVTEAPARQQGCIMNPADDISLLSAEERYNLLTDGKGSYVVSGSALFMQQFLAILVKRFYYTRRNWKGLFSQILLPALFVCIAMTVALTAPNIEDLPPITLSPAQYYNYTQPRGNFIPYSNTGWSPINSLDARPQDLIQTFRLPAGVGSTCVLLSPFNSSFDIDVLKQINSTNRDYHLVADYFQPSCQSVFTHGLRLENFVPPPPTAMPTDPPPDNPGNDSAHTIPVTLQPADQRYFPLCHCAGDNSGQICEKTGFSAPPSYTVVTNDILQDISGQDEDDFYLFTTDMYRLHRYGGFSFGLPRHFVPEEFGENAPVEFRKLAVRHAAKVWFNHKGYHAIPVYINTLNNAILRANLPKEKGNPAAYGITAINHPMNDTNTALSMEAIEQGSDVLIAIFIICAMSFVPASFVVFLVYEKSIKAKHLQYVSGVSRVVYWLANYVWDMLNYIIPAMCCILILRGFNIPAYVSNMNFPAVVSLFLMYGWSITPMMYPASFWFDEPSTAYIALIVINLFIGITCIITSFLLEMFQQQDKDLQNVHETLKQIFLLFPNYCLGRGLIDIAFNEYRNEYFFKIGEYDKMQSPFEWKIMSRNLAAMAAMGLIFFIFTLLCEFRFFYKPRRMSPQRLLPVLSEDDDVAAERKRVLKGSGRRDMLRLTNLTKVYKTQKLGRHLAVDRVTLGVPQGECFGLLGVNGAGKTTTFKMLTGDLPPSGGDATLNEYSIHSNLPKVQQNIGYCPQFDALYDELTGREHLMLYARLRGVPWKEQAKVVDWALEKLSLIPYADRLSGTYSGGNKRKLSTAIALIGHPPVIFLDEPTTGMDPHSRRFLWDLILDLIKEGRSIVLTSHSMEECEALCTRLAIMVNGTFKCLGSVQHLKTRFGDGYTVTVRVQGGDLEREASAVMRYAQRHFPECTHKGSHHNMVQFELPSTNLSLSHVFARMEEACRDLSIEDYSVSQNTLDNVFINFVEQQREIVQEAGESLTTDSRGSQDSTADLQSTPTDLDIDDDIPVVTSAGTRLAFLSMNVEG